MESPHNPYVGDCPDLGPRILLTYVALYGVLIPVVALAAIVAFVSVDAQGVNGLGVAVGVLALGVIVGVVTVPVVSIRLGLGWGTGIGLFAMMVPVLAVGLLTESGIATLVVALVWPLGVALIVHGQRTIGIVVLVLGIALSSGWGLWSESQPDRDHQEDPLVTSLRDGGVPLYCPPANDDVEWAGVWPGPFSEVTYEVAQGAHRYEVDLDNQRPQPDLEAIEDKVQPLANGPHERKSVLLRRRLKGPTWITVSAQERVEKDAEHPEGWRSAPKAGDAFAESLVACSPKELAAQSGPR